MGRAKTCKRCAQHRKLCPTWKYEEGSGNCERFSYLNLQLFHSEGGKSMRLSLVGLKRKALCQTGKYEEG